MKLAATFILFFVVNNYYSQNKKLYGTWIEYKREIVGDTNASRYTINGKLFHPNLLLTFTDDECIYSNATSTTSFSYEVDSNSIRLIGFEKQLFTKVYRYSKPKRRELILTESTINDSAVFQRKHYLKKTHHYPSKGENIYIVHKGKDVFPEIPGGTDALQKFYDTNMKIPPEVDNLSHYPAVKAMLTLSEKGKILSVEILGNPLYVLAEESLRLIKLMPDWNMGPVPDIHLSRKVKLYSSTYTYYPIEIIFKPIK